MGSTAGGDVKNKKKKNSENKHKNPEAEDEANFEIIEEDIVVERYSPSLNRKAKVIKGFILLLVVASVVILAYRYKHLVVAAKVDGGFIYTSDLNKKLHERYKDRTLDELVTIKLIENELDKNNVTVTAEDVNQRLSEIEKTLQGTSLDDALAAQNLTLESLKEQLELQLRIEKHLSSRISVSDEEVDNYLKTYEALLTAQDEDGKRAEAMESVKSEKVQLEIDTWVSELRSKGNVVTYL